MSLLVANANNVYLLLGIVAIGFVVAWWLTKRARHLGFAVVVVALIGLLWLLTRFVISDARQIEMNVHAMSDALVAGKVDELFKPIARSFDYRGIDRDSLHQKLVEVFKVYKIRDVKVSAFRIEKLSRATGQATASFRVTAWAIDHDNPGMFGFEADFVIEGNDWKLKTLRRYDPVGRNQELELPGIR